MKVLDPGHRYALDQLDTDKYPKPSEHCILRFVKRIGDKFPGNEPPGYEGTTTQEVIRALIDRTIYVDQQIPHSQNTDVLIHLRRALRCLEQRAALERGDHSAERVIRELPPWSMIEKMQTCETCGHVLCSRHVAEIADGEITGVSVVETGGAA